MTFIAKVNDGGSFTAIVNGSPAFDVTVRGESAFNATMAVMGPEGPTGVLTADAPLIYDSVLKNLSIDLSAYTTLSYANSTFQTISGMSSYLTVADAQSTYYPLTNPNGYITSVALAPYLLTSVAASTYQPIGDYATNTALTSGLALKLDKPAVAGLADQILSTDGINNIWIDNFARTLSTVVRNETGAPLAKGTVVYISGAAGNKPLVQKAIASTEMGSSRTFGILAQDIPDNHNGEAVAVGQLTKVDTFGLTEGTGLWLSPTTAGTWTTTKPTAPNHAVFLGNVVRAHQNQGVIEVRIQNGYELDELHDVAVLDRANNDVLVYESSTSLWKSKTIAEVLGYTPANNADLSNYYLASNPAGYITSAALGGYATESWVQSQGYLTAPYNPFDQSLNTTDSPTFLGLTVNDGSNTGIFTQANRLELTGISGLDGGVYVSGANVAFSLQNPDTGVIVQMDLGGFTFPDGTTQTTAATGNAFDQDLNTFDSVQFSELNVTTAAYPTYGVFITPDGTITVNDDGSALDGGIYLNGANVCIAFNSSDYQYKAYPFYGAVATAIEGGLLNANSPSATNAFATLGDVESSVNAYAASVTPVLPTADEKAALSAAASPSASNPIVTESEVPSLVPSSSTTVQGKIRSATVDETRAGLLDDTAVTPKSLRKTMISGLYFLGASGNFTTQTSGTGSSFAQVATYTNNATPNAGIAGFSRGYFVYSATRQKSYPYSSALDWSMRGEVVQQVLLSASTGSTGTTWRMALGRIQPTAGVPLTDLTNVGIEAYHSYGNNLELHYYNSGGLQKVISTFNHLTVGTKVFSIRMHWDGSGQLALEVDDVKVAEVFDAWNTTAPLNTLYNYVQEAYGNGSQSSSQNFSTFYPRIAWTNSD